MIDQEVWITSMQLTNIVHDIRYESDNLIRIVSAYDTRVGVC